MRRPQWQRDGKCAALTNCAADAYASPVQPDQFLYQRQPDATAFKGTARAAPDTMEAFKHMRQFFSGDAHACICDRDFHRLLALAQRNVYAALKSILKGIGEKVEDYFLPHLMIHVDRLAQGRAVNRQTHAGPFDDRTEAAGEIGGQRSQIGRFVHGLHAPGLAAREIPQGIDQLEQAQGVAMQNFDALALLRRKCMIFSQQVLNRPKHKRKRGTQFVGDIAEKERFGPVKLRQSFGAFPLLLICLRIADAGGDLSRDQVDKALIALVKQLERIEARNQHPRLTFLAAWRNGNSNRPMWRTLPRSRWQVVKHTIYVSDHTGLLFSQHLGKGPESRSIEGNGFRH